MRFCLPLQVTKLTYKNLMYSYTKNKRGRRKEEGEEEEVEKQIMEEKATFIIAKRKNT